MRGVVMLLLVGVLRSVSGIEMVDVRTNYVTKGVRVFHGSFGDGGTYRMFVGERGPIEKVMFDWRRMLPRLFDSMSYNYVLEVFEKRYKTYVIVHEVLDVGTRFKEGLRSLYEIEEIKFMRRNLEIYMTKEKLEIRLSVDIGKEDKSPLIKKTEECREFCTEIYTVVEEYNGAKLDGVKAHKYKIGEVYDSTKEIAIGYTKMKVFIKGCDSFLIEKRKTGEVLILSYGENKLKYEMKTLMDRQVWLAKPDGDVGEVDKEMEEAINLAKKIDNYSQLIVNVALDVSEKITPELFGVDVIKGYVGNGKYTMYEMKRKYLGMYNIVQVVDTKMEKMIIHESKSSVLTKVEVYENFKRKIVIINLVEKRGLNFSQSKFIYKLTEDRNYYYYKTNYEERSVLVAKFMKLYPIRIILNIDEDAKSIYDKGETVESNGIFKFYRIKGKDESGIDNRKKYVFGSLCSLREYEVGNIPAEKHKQRLEEIKPRINLMDLMVTKYENEMYVDMEDRQNYSIMMI